MELSHSRTALAKKGFQLDFFSEVFGASVLQQRVVLLPAEVKNDVCVGAAGTRWSARIPGLEEGREEGMVSKVKGRASSVLPVGITAQCERTYQKADSLTSRRCDVPFASGNCQPAPSAVHG